MKREVAVEIVDSLKDAGVDFVASLTEANLHDLVMALGEDRGNSPRAGNTRGRGYWHLRGRIPGWKKTGDGHDERRIFTVRQCFGDGLYSSRYTGLDVDRSQWRGRRRKRRACHRR